MTAPTRTETPGRRAITCKCGQQIAWQYDRGEIETIGARIVRERNGTRRSIICPRCGHGYRLRVEREAA